MKILAALPVLLAVPYCFGQLGRGPVCQALGSDSNACRLERLIELQKLEIVGSIRGYAQNPTLIKDAPCARDYMKAASLDGLARRKATAELFSYGCLEILDNGYPQHVYHVVAKQPPITIVSDVKKLVLWKVVVIVQDVELEDVLFWRRPGRHRDVDIDNTPDAFILDKEFIQVSADQMKALIRESGHPMDGQ